jgi:type II secretion system (T2SS) protein N
MSTTIFSGLSFGRRGRRYALIAAIIWFIGCLLYGAPAVLFVKVVRAAVPSLQLQNVSGSFWNGAAAQAFWQQNDRALALGSVEWHLQPWSLLWLHPSAHLVTNYGEQFVDAHLRVSPLGVITLTDTNAALPASLLSSWAPVPARGQFALKLDKAELTSKQWRELKGTLYWQQAQWQWNSNWLALGDYRCELTMPGAEQVRCALQGQGALAINGDITADTKQRKWAAQLQLKAEPSLPDDFRQGLQVMLAAQPNEQGKLEVKRSGRW